ncbi:tetratricopeptide repeat protein 6 isoform X3 [Odocoileus virginianus]|uniref:Tetratricopeptide repeat protein 6 isoform X3 n=1 Tax=Odocoileus virginianus TaxID=9874 RepID=A0ABM4J208_ODOVR
MSTISKHFGLKYKEESYIFKELEKVRKETKKEFLRIKEKLAAKPAVGEVPVFGLRVPSPALHGAKGSASRVGSPKPSGSPRVKGRVPPTATLPQPAPQGAPRPPGRREVVASGKSRPFRPQDFYLRSPAFLRHGPQRPPVIAPRAGTSRPVVLLPPRVPVVKARAHRGSSSPPPADSKPVLDPARGRVPSLEPAQLAEVGQARERLLDSLFSDEGDVEAAGRRGRVRINARFLPEDSDGESREAPGSASKTDHESDSREAAPQAPQPVRAIPKSIEEIIASLQSEAQLASDQTIKELIQSVLGQNYDIKMEDISLMGKVYWQKAPQMQAEQGSQISMKETQTNVLEKLPETVSSTFQIEQEDVLEWGTSDAESSLFKPQEASEGQSASESSKPLEGSQPIGDSKMTKRTPLKVKSSELLQIKGKEVKRRRKSKFGVIPQRPKKISKPMCDQKLPKKKIPEDYCTRTLHSLCTTIPAKELPIDLRVASRVYHTADRKGHNSVLGVFGTSLLDDRYTDEEQRDRILHGAPVKDVSQEYVAVVQTRPGMLPERIPGTGQSAHKPQLQLFGEEVSAYPGVTKLFWNLTSPKFSVPVSVMKETVYPKYESAQTSRILIEKFVSESKESIITLNQHRKSSRLFFLRKAASFENVQKHFSTQSPQLKRVKSAVELIKEETTVLSGIQDDMQSNIKEVTLQKAKELERWMTEQNETKESVSEKENIDSILDYMHGRYGSRDLSYTLIEASRQAGITYIVYPKKKKMRRRRGLRLSKLTLVYDELSKPPKILKRRGALNRKLGKLQSAMNDLQEAIFLEPLFLNAYWHRHFIYLFQDKINEALDDLNFINKYNKNNADAYFSRAEIFREKNEITLAILNYTQAIKCRPMDADMYFRRGEMYEIENKMLAIDDFSKCIFYDPKRTDALFKRGIFYYENENWIAAEQDFTALLNIDPQNSQARMYRGRTYFQRHFYKQAVQDLSIAVHLEPNNWLALYYRACLFRKSNPLRALQDYSVSALINDGYENLSCFLHRGILYADLKLWWLAICDFEAVICLERTITLAYINIGLIYLLHLDNYIEATSYFSEAIRHDPSYIQSYICRAEAYSKLHKLKKAVRELSYAIHLQPDGIQLYIIRGQYLLRMRCYDLAKFTIYQVAEMNKGLIELSPIQQALIYSFCENHDKAIQVLDGTMLNKPDVPMYILLAKAQMKAKRNKEATRMFKEALDLISHSDKGLNPLASADCLYHLGLCYMEEGSLQLAFDSFTKAVKANPDFPEVFYHRGLCKVKLHKSGSILDFNRAITLDPKHYQAYLSRVAYYGLKGRYSKAILSCNEAIKIYPQSVRAYVYRGVLKYYSRTYKLAITDLTTAINMDKNSYIAFYNRALCYTKINELQMALTDYGIVLLLNAGETVTLNTFINRGLIYAELEQFSFALEDFKQAALISKTNVNLCQATAICYHRNKEFEEAVNFFTWAVKIDPRFLDAYIGRGNSYMEYGHDEATKQAQKDFLKALHFNPVYTKARICLGYNLQAQGKFQKAWNHFTIAMEVDPKSYLAYEGRAVVCLQMGDNFAAFQDINAAIKINATAEFLTNRGVIHEFMGQKQNAMRDYQEAISLNPTYSLAYFNAGNIYFHHRQFSQASDYFSKALKFDPENECAAMNRAIANTVLKRYEEAKEDFAYVVESCPSWAAVYFNRAYFYCCLKQYELAEEDLSKALSLKPNDALIYNLRAEVRGKIGLIEEAMADYNKALDLQEHASVVGAAGRDIIVREGKTSNASA